jgi:nucleoid-associated protein YgaU
MGRHPAGKGLTRGPKEDVPTALGSSHNGSPARYKVEFGDTLWSIAEAHLGSADIRRIAAYWPLLHERNRELIGATPDLIRPGWRLVLPPERAR